MATKTAEAEEQETETPSQDGPVLDMSDAAVKKLIKTAKQRGFVTYDELNEVLPSEEVSSEQIEDTMSMLSDMGINVIDTEEAEEARRTRKARAARPSSRSPPSPSPRPPPSEPADRTDDPVRMYLREMGSVELLSREGEIAIAKRIEAGREAMIAGLCESPLTFQAIIIWRDELNEGKILLRDIIDLEATYQGPDAKQVPSQPLPGEEPEAEEGKADGAEDGVSKANGKADDEDKDGEDEEASNEDDDDDDMENSLSLAAMEAELKPQVLETFDLVATNYKKLRRLQDQLVEKALKNDRPLPEPGAPLQAAEGRDRRRGQVALAQCQPHRDPGREALRHQQEAAWAMRAVCCASPKAMAWSARTSSASIRATSSTPTGCAASAA